VPLYRATGSGRRGAERTKNTNPAQPTLDMALHDLQILKRFGEKRHDQNYWNLRSTTRGSRWDLTKMCAISAIPWNYVSAVFHFAEATVPEYDGGHFVAFVYD